MKKIVFLVLACTGMQLGAMDPESAGRKRAREEEGQSKSKLESPEKRNNPDMQNQNELGEQLIGAAMHGRTSMIRQLIAQGGDINFRSDMGATPLMTAAGRTYPEVVKLLIERGANINQSDPRGNTALTAAAGSFSLFPHQTESNRSQICKLLIENGADLNVQAAGKLTALMLAAQRNYPQVVQVLLTTLPLSERQKIQEEKHVINSIHYTRELTPDMRRQLMQEFINSLAEDQITRIRQSLSLRNTDNQTARDIALANNNAAIAQMLDMNNPHSLEQLRKHLRNNIKRILFGEPVLKKQAKKRTYYDVLDLNQNASPAEIKAAYRKLALQYHPDKASRYGYSPEQAQKLFTDLNEAYAVLSNPAKRKQYDQTLK